MSIWTPDRPLPYYVLEERNGLLVPRDLAEDVFDLEKHVEDLKKRLDALEEKR